MPGAPIVFGDKVKSAHVQLSYFSVRITGFKFKPFSDRSMIRSATFQHGEGGFFRNRLHSFFLQRFHAWAGCSRCKGSSSNATRTQNVTAFLCAVQLKHVHTHTTNTHAQRHTKHATSRKFSRSISSHSNVPHLHVAWSGSETL